MDFHQLEALRRQLKSTAKTHVPTLAQYFDGGLHGFFHVVPKPKLSLASTATCVLSLVRCGRWLAATDADKYPWEDKAESLAQHLLDEKWASAGLPKDNLFTTAFVLECISELESVSPPNATLPANAAARIAAAEKRLLRGVRNGYAQIGQYPASAYVTQLVVRTLQKRQLLASVRDTTAAVLGWARAEIANQLALVHAKSKTADAFQLAYAIMLVVSLEEPSKTTPDDARRLAAALKAVFDAQLDDGSWPRSRPLFHYKNVGSAYCYEYEMLVQLIDTFRGAGREDRLLPHLEAFEKAFGALGVTSYKLADNALAWSSGHHPQLAGPESWSTASAYHFVHSLERLLAEAVRQAVFEYLDVVYTPPRSPRSGIDAFAPKFLDATFTYRDHEHSLRNVLYNSFVARIAQNEWRIAMGESLPDDVPSSMIIFGPPGTAKTELAKIIADYLGWPRLTVDPSHLVRNGLDQVQAEANTVFGMLEVAERVVVLFDEFDELVRERQGSHEALSRFLTTSMLPKLAAINRERRIVFIVATNHIEHFDLAISRTGRFDLILPVLPPTTKDKLKHWKEVDAHLQKLGVQNKTTDDNVKHLTYGEFAQLAPSILLATTTDEAIGALGEAKKTSTWESHQVRDGATWGEAVTKEIPLKTRFGV